MPPMAPAGLAAHWSSTLTIPPPALGPWGARMDAAPCTCRANCSTLCVRATYALQLPEPAAPPAGCTAPHVPHCCAAPAPLAADVKAAAAGSALGQHVSHCCACNDAARCAHCRCRAGCSGLSARCHASWRRCRLLRRQPEGQLTTQGQPARACWQCSAGSQPLRLRRQLRGRQRGKACSPRSAPAWSACVMPCRIAIASGQAAAACNPG